MMRSAADFEMPKSGASWRIVKFVRQYVVTSSTRSSSGRLHGRPRRTASAPSRRNAATNLPKQRGLSPVNGAIQDGSDAVITTATARHHRKVRSRRLEQDRCSGRPRLHTPYGNAGSSCDVGFGLERRAEQQAPVQDEFRARSESCVLGGDEEQ